MKRMISHVGDRRLRGLRRFLLLLLVLLPLTGCAADGGARDQYDGFVVRTQRTREEVASAAAGERTLSLPDRENESEEADFVLNMSSGKFHYPWCSAVSEIAEKNRWNYHGWRESVLELGYVPCKNCNP